MNLVTASDSKLRTKSRSEKTAPAISIPPDYKGPAREYWARIKAERAAKQAWASAPRVTINGFKDDPMFPRVERAVAAILADSKVVTPIDVLIRMELLKPDDVENWRFGRTPYLERVIHCNLTKLGRLLRILRMHAHDLKLVPTQTAYVRWGKRGHRAPLRFSKTGDPKVEEAYKRHFVWPGKRPFFGSQDQGVTTGDGPERPTGASLTDCYYFAKDDR